MDRYQFALYLHIARFRGHGFVWVTRTGDVCQLAKPRGLR